MTTLYNGHEILEIMEEAKNYNHMLEDFIQSHGQGSLWLDFGAGNGHFANALAKSKTKNKARIHCLETDPQMQKKLRQSGFTVYESSENLPPHYDFIYSINVLEHIAEHESIAKKLISLLKPGGRLLIYVPAFPSLFSPLDQKIGHHRRYKRKTLLPLFTELKTLRCEYVDSIGYFASFYLKYFAHDDKPLSKNLVSFYDHWIFPLSRRLDPLSRPYFGKNLFYVGEKPQVIPPAK